MRKLFTLLFTALAMGATAQNEVKVTEGQQSFSVGSKNSIIVSIPYGKMDIVEKQLKSEMKNWGGKYSSSKGESKTIQANPKFMGGKAFDAYAKVLVSGSVMQVAVAVDLGGAFMTSSQHSAQYNSMKEKLTDFAVKTAKECVAEDLKAEQKILAGFEKDQKDLEKEKESMLKSIEDYKKKIAETETKIQENVGNQSKKSEEISRQAEKVSEVGKRNIR